MEPIDRARLARIKTSFTTRRVAVENIAWLDTAADDLSPGDLVIARVEELHQHKRIERPDGRRAHLFIGDEILLACGARYAPDQFEAACPTAAGPAHLAAAGGIAGVVQSAHDRMKPATEITILGAVQDRNRRRLNLRDFAVSTARRRAGVAQAGISLAPPTPVIAVCGTSMNAGKTHTVASIVHGLAHAGRRVAAVKVTGTGSGGDLWSFVDAGAAHVADFTDAGFASTYQAPFKKVLAGALTLIDRAEAKGAEAVVVEIADGLGQAETAGLLRDPVFRARLRGVMFAAGDALGALGGVAWLERAGHKVLGVAGCLTRSPLATGEVSLVPNLTCFDAAALRTPEVAEQLVGLKRLGSHTAAEAA